MFPLLSPAVGLRFFLWSIAGHYLHVVLCFSVFLLVRAPRRAPFFYRPLFLGFGHIASLPLSKLEGLDNGENYVEGTFKTLCKKLLVDTVIHTIQVIIFKLIC